MLNWVSNLCFVIQVTGPACLVLLSVISQNEADPDHLLSAQYDLVSLPERPLPTGCGGEGEPFARQCRTRGGLSQSSGR